MNSNDILKSDVLDIIFENKNKMYGAYTLRKHYNNRLYKAIGIAFLIFTVAIGFSFISKPEIEIAIPYTEMAILKAAPDKPKEQPKEQKIEHKKTNIQPQATQKRPTQPVIVTFNIPIDTTTKVDPNLNFGTVNNPIGGTTTIVTYPGGGDGGGSGGGEPKPPVIPEPLPDANIPVETADVYPEFPGGQKALLRFLQKNLTNPRDMEEGEEISVRVKFVVAPDGKLKSFDIVKDGGDEFNKEVIRVLKKMPDWIPGKSKGRDVAVYSIIPVKFIPAE